MKNSMLKIFDHFDEIDSFKKIWMQEDIEI